MAEGLFNYQDPRLVRQAYTEQFQTPERELNRLDLLGQVAAMGGNAGASIGSGLGRLFGGKAPQEAENDLMREIFKQADEASSDPIERGKLAAQGLRKAGMEGRAVQLEQEIAKMSTQMAQSKKAQAEAAATETEMQRENQLREALSALPENATPEQYLAIVRKFGSPDKIMTSIQTSMDREEQRKQALELKKMEIERRLEEARLRGEQAQELERIRVQGRRELAQFAASLKTGQQSQKPERYLPASLEKAEQADYEAIESAEGLNMSLEPVIQSLGGFGEKPGKAELNLGAANNLMNTARNFLGQSTPESRQYSQLEETKIRIINDSLRLNKGTQTEGDAQRAAREVEAAWAKNDTEATRQALLRLYKINERAAKNKEKQIERRRQSQGVSSGPKVGTADNPIKLD